MIKLDDLKEQAREHISYEKDKATRIATITLNRPETLNSASLGMRHLYADFLYKANIDDDVKVVVIRGTGAHLGAGGDLGEQSDMLSESASEDVSLLHEFGIDDPDVRYPPKQSYRFLNALFDHGANPRGAIRPLQDFKKISILEAKGYCYGWHFYQAADADLIISSDDALFGHPAFRYAGFAPRFWSWIETMGLRRFQEMLFTGRPFSAAEMAECGFVNRVVPREQLETETAKYALTCSRNRPTDTIVAQKAFLEIYKQYRGEYMGSRLMAMIESTLPQMTNDAERDLQLGDEVFRERGLNNVVKDADLNFPPEWRYSRSNRKKP